jgi:hypothetical protein
VSCVAITLCVAFQRVFIVVVVVVVYFVIDSVRKLLDTPSYIIFSRDGFFWKKAWRREYQILECIMHVTPFPRYTSSVMRIIKLLPSQHGICRLLENFMQYTALHLPMRACGKLMSPHLATSAGRHYLNAPRLLYQTGWGSRHPIHDVHVTRCQI